MFKYCKAVLVILSELLLPESLEKEIFEILVTGAVASITTVFASSENTVTPPNVELHMKLYEPSVIGLILYSQ